MAHRSVSRAHGRPLRHRPTSPFATKGIFFLFLLSLLGLLLETAPAADAAPATTTTATPTPIITTTCSLPPCAPMPAVDRQIPSFNYGPSAQGTTNLLFPPRSNKHGRTSSSTSTSTSTRHRAKNTDHFPGSIYDTPGHAIAAGLIVGVTGTAIFWAIIGAAVFLVKVYFVWIWRALVGVWRGWHWHWRREEEVDTRRWGVIFV